MAAVAAAALVLWLMTGAGGPDVVAVASILAQLAAPLLAAGACVARAPLQDRPAGLAAAGCLGG